MPAVFEYAYQISEKDIDGQGHANNISYFQWLQDAALAHSKEQGWATADYREQGWSWVVRSHSIEYRRPVFLDDQIIVKTWVADMKKYSSLRKYEVTLSETGKLVVRAETNWAFVESETGRLIAVPAEVISAFEIWNPDSSKG